MNRSAVLVAALASTLIAGRAPAQSSDWTEPFPPFRIAGNLYYVGSKGLANYLVTTPQGHILINSDLEANVPLIRASIEQLGFKFSDVKILLINHAHWDHDAGSAKIKALTGATYMVMDADVPVVESGGKLDFQYGNDPATLYPPTRVDRVLHDGDTVKLGDAALVAHLTPGHTRGNTTWTMAVRDGGTTYNAVIVGSPNVNTGYKLVDNATYPAIAEDFARTFRVLKSLPCDLFLGAHGAYFGMEEKYARMKAGAANAFVDRQGCAAFINQKEQEFRAELAKQTAAKPGPPAATQNPSPMAEATRTHERLAKKDIGGTKRSFAGPAGKPVDLWIPDRARTRDAFDLVVHFLGEAWLPEQAVASLDEPAVAAVLNLGAGSGVYHRAFSEAGAFDSLLAGVTREVSTATGRAARVGRITLVGFSAGHGAIRVILREPRYFAKVDAVLLLDGMHTSYVPEGTVLASGGTLDTTNLVAFAAFARAAVKGEKRFLVTHSEIFPGTFASTTETADWLITALGLHRAPVLRWGPRGMQQLSEARAGKFEVLGFAGNSAPDHIDQLHAMPELLARLLR